MVREKNKSKMTWCRLQSLSEFLRTLDAARTQREGPDQKEDILTRERGLQGGQRMTTSVGKRTKEVK